MLNNNCNVCCKYINDIDKVEILIENLEHNPRNILGKYKWVLSQYCINCLEQSKIHMWKLYLSLINNSRCYSTFQDIIKYPIPVRLTDNLKLLGNPIIALYYHDEMISAKLQTNMSDYEFYNFQEKIKKQKENIMEYENFHNLFTIRL